jgi:2-amino-4-hydroxy-6-hydroxymethyldihydropteridine diphosphokinase
MGSVVKAAVALGSNLGNRLPNLQRARDRVCMLQGTIPPILQSAVYETAPVGCEPGAPRFYNAVIEIGFAEIADELLRGLQEIEHSLGRGRDHAPSVSRTIDLDLLYFGEEQRSRGALQLPHPRMKEREFVLRPLADIVPELRLPGETASVRDLLAQIAKNDPAKCVTRDW